MLLKTSLNMPMNGSKK